jgi:Raf kinase inhibitor-like YbhB/YbcL family protein
MPFIIQSPAFIHNEIIPMQYTCEGRDISPALEWTSVPEGTESLALIVDDPDAPDPKAPKMTYVHWVLYNIPANVPGLKEAIESKDLPEGTKEGLNDWKRLGYGGPCPPIGEHRYFFKLYALNCKLPDLSNPTKAQLEKAMEGKVISKTEFIGKYTKKR